MNYKFTNVKNIKINIIQINIFTEINTFTMSSETTGMISVIKNSEYCDSISNGLSIEDIIDLPNTTSLTLSLFYYNNKCNDLLKSLVPQPSITELSANSSNLTEESALLIPILFPNIEKLHLRCNSKLTGITFTTLLNSCNKLKHLNVGLCNNEKNFDISLLNDYYPNIEILEIDAYHSANDWTYMPFLKLLLAGNRFPNLVKISIGFTYINEVGFYEIVDLLPTIKEIKCRIRPIEGFSNHIFITDNPRLLPDRLENKYRERPLTIINS